MPSVEKNIINLTPRSIERLKENDPLYKYVDYYIERDGQICVDTMTVEEYNEKS